MKGISVLIASATSLCCSTLVFWANIGDSMMILYMVPPTLGKSYMSWPRVWYLGQTGMWERGLVWCAWPVWPIFPSSFMQAESTACERHWAHSCSAAWSSSAPICLNLFLSTSCREGFLRCDLTVFLVEEDQILWTRNCPILFIKVVGPLIFYWKTLPL